MSEPPRDSSPEPRSHADEHPGDGPLFDAAKRGDAATLGDILDQSPEKLHVRQPPYEWSLLHIAAHAGHLAVVNLLLERGMDPNTKEKGDHTFAIHWAAAAGHVAVVRRLADAGGDVIGHGDDHELDVIGWATCWEECDDDAHRSVARLLLERGARHHIFSAVAMNLDDEVRRIVAADPGALSRRMSRNEDHQLPLHFAVRMNRPAMVRLLLELGADPLGVDGSGNPPAMYAGTATMDRPLMEAIHAMTLAELDSARRGQRAPRVRAMDLLAALALGQEELAERLVAAVPGLIQPGGAAAGALHVMAKRGDVRAVRWLLHHDAQPNARWNHWDAEVTPLHLAILAGHVEVVRILLDAGADPTLRDSQHDGDARDWAEFFRRREVLEILDGGASR